MDLNAVYTEILEALSSIEGLRVNPTNSRRIVPPAVIPAAPTEIEYDRSYGGAGGLSRVELRLTVLVSLVTMRDGVSKLLGYASTSGPMSIKAAIEAATYTSCQTVVVVRAENFGALPLGDTSYLSANFAVEVHG